jgi:hypothetical protein
MEINFRDLKLVNQFSNIEIQLNDGYVEKIPSLGQNVTQRYY